MMIHKLCQELNYKENEVYEMNYINALNWLSMFKEKDKYLEHMYKNNT